MSANAESRANVLGFTGTRKGMTPSQVRTVSEITESFDEIHHGDCVGADVSMHWQARRRGRKVIIHPPEDARLRAFSSLNDCAPGSEKLPEKPYLDRNRDIVDAASVVLVTPSEMSEQSKGGTWYTVRHARQAGKPVVIVWPDGTVAHSDGSEDE